MGLIQALNSLMFIFGAHDETGISYEDIIEINRKTTKAKIEHHWEYLKPNKNNWGEKIIVEKNGLYFLTPEYKEMNKEFLPEWKECLEDMLSKAD